VSTVSLCSAFCKKNILRYRHPVAINVKTDMLLFGILANHKIKMCHNSMKKNNDTKDYSKQLEFLNSEPYYANKKIVNHQSPDFPVRRTGSYRHKKALSLSQ